MFGHIELDWDLKTIFVGVVETLLHFQNWLKNAIRGVFAWGGSFTSRPKTVWHDCCAWPSSLTKTTEPVLMMAHSLIGWMNLPCLLQFTSIVILISSHTPFVMEEGFVTAARNLTWFFPSLTSATWRTLNYWTCNPLQIRPVYSNTGSCFTRLAHSAHRKIVMAAIITAL